jgi:hypothetical protein
MGPNGRAVQRARIHLETPNGRAPNREVSPSASSAASFYCVIKLLFGNTGIETTNRGVYAVTSAPQAALTAGGGTELATSAKRLQAHLRELDCRDR